MLFNDSSPHMMQKREYKGTQVLTDIHDTGSQSNKVYIIEPEVHLQEGNTIVVGQNLLSELHIYTLCDIFIRLEDKYDVYKSLEDNMEVSLIVFHL